jgi:FtsH-binding integral membrane protein
MIRGMTTPGYAAPIALDRDRTRAIFGQVMGLVALTCGFTALGAYIGRDLTGLTVLLPWLLAFGCIIGLNVANARGARQVALALLFATGLLLGIAVGNWVSSYAAGTIYQAAGATGLFVAALGAGGYATRRDLSGLYRLAFFLLLGLIVFGIVLIFVNIPGGALIYSILGLGVFGLYTVIDFNRLKRAGQAEVIPLAAGIFLDVFNIFLFFLQIFGGSNR